MSRRSSTSTMKLDGFSPGGTTRFESAISTMTPGPRTALRPVCRRAPPAAGSPPPAPPSCRSTAAAAAAPARWPRRSAGGASSCSSSRAVDLAGEHLLCRGRELVARQRAVPLHGADEADHRQRHRDRDAPGGRGAEAPSARAGHGAHDGSPPRPRRRADQAAKPGDAQDRQADHGDHHNDWGVHDRPRRRRLVRTTPCGRFDRRTRPGPGRRPACRHRTAGWRLPRPAPGSSTPNES